MRVVVAGILILQPGYETANLLIFEKSINRMIVVREFFFRENRVYFVMADAMHSDLFTPAMAARHKVMFIDRWANH